MKFKEISLVAIGAMAAITIMAAVSVLFYTPKAPAQGAAAMTAPGGVSVSVTAANTAVAAGGTAQFQGGTILVQDGPNRKVTVYSYTYELFGNTTTPTLQLSGASTFTY